MFWHLYSLPVGTFQTGNVTNFPVVYR
ncbi:MAG TPA: hypothetical protein EYO32_07210 [Rhodospirillales bacterium]|nr:hypothetical protein [Rhodospirillales bacterium]HIB21295.1 hypothetical protein [Rhodospirillales bacterium]HIC60774.1 hypothetical protein [Rhodospirillales bacterium]HIN76834.1 hypothetical protein [Rhodospirillales bacterium]